MHKIVKEKIKRFFKRIFEELVLINDTPQRIAFGFAIGAFMGILPGTGPVAAIAVATLFKVNKAAAFLGGLLTNTWLSFMTLILAIKIGAVLFGFQWQTLRNIWTNLIKDFHWNLLLSRETLKFIIPVAAGFLIISLLFGLIIYLISLAVLTIYHKIKAQKQAPKV
jgi:uncharacterized protein (DUF2062 family)